MDPWRLKLFLDNYFSLQANRFMIFIHLKVQVLRMMFVQTCYSTILTQLIMEISVAIYRECLIEGLSLTQMVFLYQNVRSAWVYEDDRLLLSGKCAPKQPITLSVWPLQGLYHQLYAMTDACGAGSCLISSAQQLHKCGNGISKLLVWCMRSCYWVLMVHGKMIQQSVSPSPPELTALPPSLWHCYKLKSDLIWLGLWLLGQLCGCTS